MGLGHLSVVYCSRKKVKGKGKVLMLIHVIQNPNFFPIRATFPLCALIEHDPGLGNVTSDILETPSVIFISELWYKTSHSGWGTL